MTTNLNDFLERSLSKWPTLVVSGTPVTRRQAQEIIIRTSSFYSYFCNDDNFETQLEMCLGIYSKLTDKRKYTCYQHLDLLRAKYKNEFFDHFDSSNRIATCYAYGPHGWMNWDGTICSAHSIGKWPSVREVYYELRKLVSMFPYLQLTAQIIEYEGDNYDEERKIVEFNLKNKILTVSEPISDLSDTISIVTKNRTFGRNSKGCTITEFKKALKVTRENIRKRK